MPLLALQQAAAWNKPHMCWTLGRIVRSKCIVYPGLPCLQGIIGVEWRHLKVMPGALNEEGSSDNPGQNWAIVCTRNTNSLPLLRHILGEIHWSAARELLATLPALNATHTDKREPNSKMAWRDVHETLFTVLPVGRRSLPAKRGNTSFERDRRGFAAFLVLGGIWQFLSTFGQCKKPNVWSLEHSSQSKPKLA